MGRTDEWIDVNSAALIMSKRSGHEISPVYVRLLAHRGKIDMKPKNQRENLYLRKDVENYRVKKGSKKQEPVPA